MNVAIIDDEVHCIESLVLYLNDLFPEVNIVYKTNKVQEAAEKIKDLSLDLVFLDIEMPGMTGFQFLERFPEREFDVIFVTAYSEYALQAFKAKAINYLLKPINEDELKEVVKSWKNSRKKDTIEQTEKIDQLIEDFKKKGLLESKISIPISDGYEFIEINDIIYCKSDSNYTSFYLINGGKIMVSKTMKEAEQVLEKFMFIRVHQSYIINPNCMQRFTRADGGYVIMKDGMEIPISKAKKNLIINLFDMVKKRNG